MLTAEGLAHRYALCCEHCVVKSRLLDFRLYFSNLKYYGHRL
jgi:hypothetical protein